MMRLLLLGGGHAQVQAIEPLGKAAPGRARITLLDRARYCAYSGMLPGMIAGHYTHADCHIDLAALCAQARIDFVQAEATSLDLNRQRVVCADGTIHDFDLLSIDTGSASPAPALPGAAEHAIAVRPTERFLAAVGAFWSDADARFPANIAVVGGGAGSVEVVLALARRAQLSASSYARPELSLLTDREHILTGFPARTRKSAERILDRYQVRVHTRARVQRVDHAGVEVADGQRITAERVLLLTGARADGMYAAAGLRTDAHGFISVDATLRSMSHPAVYAAGDIASIIGHPRPKSGVFAVRQGPILAQNLLHALDGTPPRAYRPQRHFLTILSAGSRYAIATRNGFSIEGAWVWRWKDRIDRGYMARFQSR